MHSPFLSPNFGALGRQCIYVAQKVGGPILAFKLDVNAFGIQDGLLEPFYRSLPSRRVNRC